MDIIAAKLGANMAISELIESGRIGSATKPIYTYDGDIGEGGLIKISDSSPDLNKLIKVKGYLNGVATELPKDALIISEDDEGGQSATMNGSPVTLLMSVNIAGFANNGLFINALNKDNYINYIEFAETIKPIDPKYLVREVDLTKFNVEYGGQSMTLNDLVLYLANESINAGGALQTVKYILCEGFRQALSTTQQVVITMDTPYGTRPRFPTMISLLDGVVGNASVNGMVYMGAPVTVNNMFTWDNDKTDEKIEIHIKVTPVA